MGPCLVWTGSPRSKYAMVWDPDEGVPVLVHRAMYKIFVGSPTGQIDHLCRVYKCASLAHLEDVSQRENLRRNILTYEHVEPLSVDPETCLRGHRRTPENTGEWRSATGKVYSVCRICTREQSRLVRERARAELGLPELPPYRGANGVKTHCPQGHAYDDANTHVDRRTGRRSCRACKVIHSRAYRERLAADRPAA